MISIITRRMTDKTGTINIPVLLQSGIISDIRGGLESDINNNAVQWHPQTLVARCPCGQW